MMAKYVAHAHPGMVGGSVGVSSTWRRMLQVREVAERHITFVIRSGSSHLWPDNWPGLRPLPPRLGSDSEHRIADFLLDGRWNYQPLVEWVPADIVDATARFALPRRRVGVGALMVWALLLSGPVFVRSVLPLA